MDVMQTNRRVLTAREAALDALVAVEAQGAYSNLALHRVLPRTSPRDKALVTELVYGTLKRQNTLDWFLARLLTRPLAELALWVKVLLRLSLYQLYYLTRVPSHAVVYEAVEIAKRRGHKGIAALVNGVLRRAVREGKQPLVSPDLPALARKALELSHPEALIARWEDVYGPEETRAMCEANNAPAPVAVRVNPLKGSREEVAAHLAAEGWASVPSPLAPDGLRITGGPDNIVRSVSYRAGYVTVQDESSMLAARLLDPLPGARVLDLCAAPGGKATHLAERMGNRGEVVAVDDHAHKIPLIAENAARLGLTIVRPVCADGREAGERWPEAFDAVLLDAPCSGYGVIRRRPEIKWRKTDVDVEALVPLQRELLEAAARALKPGGVLVYSTCTVEPRENGEQIRAFLADHPEMEPDPSGVAARLAAVADRVDPETGSVQLLPHHFGSDGFFLARLRKRGERR
ncbi:16S rRNA (cytosine(967)-C(5))-methyltransferase RsmB [Calditerricola yamamurae]